MNKIFLSLYLGTNIALYAAPSTVTLIDGTLRNGSFENGSGNTNITGWQTGFGGGEAQRKEDNTSQGNWSLVLGQASGDPNLAATINTGHSVAAGNTFDLSFKWLPKWGWDAEDQVKWRLFTTSDDTAGGVISEINSGTVSGFSNGAPYQTVTLTNILGVSSVHENRQLRLQFLRGNSSTGEFARLDEVDLSVTTDVIPPSYVSLTPSQMIAYYPMEDTAEDYSADPVRHDGIWNTGEAYASGIIGKRCADLTGAGDSITLPHTLANSFTLTFWIKTTTTAPAGTQWWQGLGILDASTSGETNDIGVSLLGSKIALGAGNPDTSIMSLTSVNNGSWHHVAVQRHSASGALRLFVDGVLEAELTGPAGVRDSSAPLILGSLASGANFINASIDDIRIFDQALDEASIAQLHSTAGDFDGDGHSDLQELIVVSAWTNSRDVMEVPIITVASGATECKLTINAFAGRIYTLQRSSTLIAGSWTDIGVSTTPHYNGELVLTDPSPVQDRIFYRALIHGRGPVLEKKPNIVIIYGDDVGYGDVTAYNAASKIATPNIDQLAAEGLLFTDAHCTASTCSPSRYSMLTGIFAFRDGVSILRPTAALSIREDAYTLPDMLKSAGYNTAVIGKWHLGIGNGGNSIDWNGEIKPGPLEIGFDTCFMIPTTNDRVPCVYLKDHNIVGLDPADPIYVHNSSYAAVNVAGSTQYPRRDVSAQTYYTSSSGHNDSVVSGIGRIGYMSGGQSALWDDETMAQTFLQKAKDYINAQDGETPFFLYFSSQDIHVPRAPHSDFQGATGLGFRGDAMVQFDWVTGQLMQALKDAGLDEDTIVIFSSDNGPVLDDGYHDGARNDAAQGHDSSGIYRGGKYSILEGGTRVPFIVRWPAKIQPGVSHALVNQVDFMGSFAAYLNIELPSGSAKDSRNSMDALLGIDPVGLPFTVEQNNRGNLKALRVGDMKYTGGKLYDLSTDLEERTNLSGAQPAVAAAMAQQLTSIVNGNGVREEE